MSQRRTYSMTGIPPWILIVAPWVVGVIEIARWIIRGTGL